MSIYQSPLSMFFNLPLGIGPMTKDLHFKWSSEPLCICLPLCSWVSVLPIRLQCHLVWFAFWVGCIWHSSGCDLLSGMVFYSKCLKKSSHPFTSCIKLYMLEGRAGERYAFSGQHVCQHAPARYKVSIQRVRLWNRDLGIIYSIWVLTLLSTHCTGHVMTGSFAGRENQYIQLVKILYCKLPTNRKQLPAFPLEVGPGYKLRSQRWEARVLPLCHHGPHLGIITTQLVRLRS